MSTLDERSADRRRRLVAHVARSPEEAEAWDLEFWQDAGPEVRLSALVAIHEDITIVEAARSKSAREATDR
jgi:hypothetical protein